MSQFLLFIISSVILDCLAMRYHTRQCVLPYFYGSFVTFSIVAIRHCSTQYQKWYNYIVVNFLTRKRKRKIEKEIQQYILFLKNSTLTRGNQSCSSMVIDLPIARVGYSIVFSVNSKISQTRLILLWIRSKFFFGMHKVKQNPNLPNSYRILLITLHIYISVGESTCPSSHFFGATGKSILSQSVVLVSPD